MRSFYQVKDLLDRTQREEVIGFLYSATNYFVDGKTRFWPASTGSFMMCNISLVEAEPWLPGVIEKVNAQTGETWQPRVSNILEYRHNNYVPPHQDVSSTEQATTHTLIIPLNDRDQYGGGQMMIAGKEIDVAPGDGVIYSHDTEHSVEPIRGGIRYAWIIRLREDK